MSAAADLALRAFVLLSIASLVSFALRRRSASLSALVWTTALGGLLLLPLFSLVTPAWHLEVLPAPAYAAAAVPAGIADIDAPRVTMRAPGAPRAVDMPPEPSAPAPIASADAQVAAAPATDPALAPFTAGIQSLMPMAAVLFAMVCAALLSRIAISHARMARIVRDGRDAGGDWAALSDEIAHDMGVSRAVDVRISGAISVPAVVGIVRPVLLVPADAADWPAEMRRAVVLHELAHVARHDALSQLICQIACAVYWCIPLTWYGARRAAALRERASDDHVLRAGVRASSYAESLIGLARLARGADLHAAALSMARPSRMRERVVAILDPSMRRETPARLTVSALLVASCAAIAAIAAARPVQAAGASLPEVPSLGGLTAVQPAAFGAASLPGTTVVTSQPASAATFAVATPASSSPAPDIDTPATDARAAGAPPAQAATGGPCSSGNLDSSSMSRSEDDGRRTWKMTLEGPGCEVDLRAEGQFEFNNDFTDIARVSRGGYFRLDVTESGTRRQLDIEGDGSRRWRVNGREQQFDAAARTWLAGFLIELDRRTAVGVDVRLPALLRQGGVNAVLDETARMGSDFARTAYYSKLAKATSLSPADVTRILTQAADLTKSDFYAHEVIKAFAARGPANGTERAAITRLIEGMDSDFYRAESIKKLVAAGPPDQEGVEFVIRLVGKMDSDFYQHSVVTTALKGASLSPAQQARLTSAVSQIDSDFYASAVLREVADTGTMSPETRRAYFAGIGGLDSDHYRTEALRALLKHGELTESDLLEVVAAADDMSDHYASETMRDVLRHGAASDRVQQAVLTAAAGMSRHYRQELERAAGRR